MRATAEPLDGNKVKLLIDVDVEEIDKAVDEAFKKIATQVRIPGFRPGKAPRRILESHVGMEAARAQALNDALPSFYMKALSETDTDAIASPSIEITNGRDEGPVTFEAEVDVRPVPQIPGYQGLEVEVPNPEVSDSDVDDAIDRMRAQYGELEVVERAAKAGDFVTLDINGTREGEPVPGLTASDYSYEVGNKMLSLGEDFDGQVEGAKAGDVKEFSSTVPPNDDTVDFRVEIKVVNERKLPELNDEWAGEASEFETVAELRADIEKQLKRAKAVEAERSLRNGVIKAVAELVDEDVPETLVNDEMNRQARDFANTLAQQGVDLGQFLAATGQGESEFIERIRENAVASVRADLALRSLAEKENLQVTDEDVDEEIQLLADQFGQKADRVRKDLEHAEQMPAVRSDIRKAKAVKWLMENVSAVDSDGNKVDTSLIRSAVEAGDETESGEAKA